MRECLASGIPALVGTHALPRRGLNSRPCHRASVALILMGDEVVARPASSSP